MRTRIIIIGGILLPVLLLTGCNEALHSIGFPDFSNVQFTVSAGDTSSEGASLTVSHDGSDRDTYYGFATKDTESDINAVVNRKISELSTGGTDYTEIIKNGSFRLMSVDGLESSTLYRYIVFGLNDDGTTYGTPGSCLFTTAKGQPVFGLSVVGSPMFDAVNLNVTTTGDEEDYWYCFATTDLTTSLETLCQTTVNKNTDISGHLQSGTKTFELSGLRHNTDYRAAVIGVKDGKAYGKPASVEFTTPLKDVVPQLNPSWTIENLGEGELANKGETNTFKQRISCTATSADRYFIMVMAQTDMRRYYNDNLATFFIEAAAYMTSSLDASNKEAGTSYTWADISYTDSAQEGYNLVRVGDYNAYAIGVDDAGTPTGLYAVSPTFSIDPAPMSDACREWLGKWTIGDGLLDYDVTVTPDPYQVENQFAVYGWEGDELLEVPFVAQFDEQTGKFIFIASFLANISLVENGSTISASLGFFGLSGAELFMPQSDQAYEIAEASFTNSEKTRATATAKSLQVDEAGETVTFTSMGYFASARGTGDIISFSNTHPSMPLTMVKRSSDTTVPFSSVIFNLPAQSPLKNYEIFDRFSGKVLSIK
ncbi:MAG: hypothetical protein ACI395_00075 [Candidatus Cryptobacteroides sp.]